MINLYNNYKYTGKWDTQGADHNQVLVALAKNLKQKRAKYNNIPGNPTSSATKTTTTNPENSNGSPTRKFKNDGNITTCPDTGSKYKC